MILTDAETDKINSIFAIVMNKWHEGDNRFSLQWMIRQKVVDEKLWKQLDQFGVEIELGNVRLSTGAPIDDIYSWSYVWVLDKKGVIAIGKHDDGPWWDVIRMAIPRLEKDAKAMAARIPEYTRIMLEPQERQRKEELQRAAEAVKKNKPRW